MIEKKEGDILDFLKRNNQYRQRSYKPTPPADATPSRTISLRAHVSALVSNAINNWGGS